MHQTTFQYNSQQRRWHEDYKREVKELTNRQLLREERQERELLDCLKESEDRKSKYYLGDDLPSVKRWAIRNHSVTLAEIEARGYVWKKDKYVKVKVQAHAVNDNSNNSI